MTREMQERLARIEGFRPGTNDEDAGWLLALVGAQRRVAEAARQYRKEQHVKWYCELGDAIKVLDALGSAPKEGGGS